MLSDWLKTQKKPTRTNQIKAVLTKKKIQEKWPLFAADDDGI